MTPLDLQDELVVEMKRLLSDYRYKAPGGKRVQINAFAQSLPINKTDDEADPVPYIIVRLNEGKDDGMRDSNNIVSLVIVICTWDDALDSQGYRDVANIIQKIYERFHTNPNLNGKAVYSGKFDWMLQEDNYYPYSFGACSLSFNIPAIRREDPFA